MTKRGGRTTPARGGARACLSILGAVTLMMVGAFGAARPVAARTTADGVQISGSALASAHAPEVAAPADTAPHIMLIVEENEGYKDVIGSSSAPYINGLVSSYVSATNWYAVQHNSPHDYLDLTIGSDLGLPHGTPYSVPMVVDELHSAGIPWKGYMESMPSNCANGSSSNGLYDTNHNPFHYFARYSSGSGGWCNSANLSTEGVLPDPGPSGLVTALDGSNAPDFVFLVPNDCDDMHGDTNSGSPCGSDSNSQLIKTGDTWLSNTLPGVLTSSWFKQNGIVIITWDEGSDSSGCCGLGSPGGHIPTIVVTTGNQGSSAFATTGDHYGTLRAIEEAYGVGFLGGSANTGNGDLTGAFGKGKVTTGSISGTVTDSVTSAPLSGVGISYSGGSTTTNSSGAYTLAGVAPGTYTVTASATGYTTGSASVTVTAGATATKDFALVATKGSVSGKVTDAQTAAGIAGATVTCTCASGGAVTGAGGTYSFTNVTPGSGFSIVFADTGYVSQTFNNITVAAGHATTQNAQLVEDGSITGQVTDANTHLAITGATVTCTCQTGSKSTNSSGNYTFSNLAPAGNYSMTFSFTGDTPLTVNNVGVTPGQTTTKNVTLGQPSGSVTGTVTDGTAGGSPTLSGVSVTCSCQGGSVATDGSGKYSLTNVTPGTYSLTFSDSGFVTQSITGVGVTSGTATTKNAALTEDGGISGTVIDAQSDTPITTARISCSGCPTTTATTDNSGDYAFTHVPNGSSYSLTFTASGYVTQTITNVTVTGPVLTPESIALNEDGEISGAVTDAQTTQPLSRVTVTCTSGCPVSASTDSLGDYSISNVPPGTYSLTFSESGYVTQTTLSFVVASGSPTIVNTVALTEDGGITGTVTDQQSTQPISGATMTCAECPTTTATTDFSGGYAFTNVPNGAAYSIAVTAPGYVTQTLTGVTVTGPNTTMAASIALTEVGTVSGTVVAAGSLAPIQNATLTCTCATGSAATDASGDYTFAQVAPGAAYTVSVSAAGFSGQIGPPFAVNPGSTSPVNFQLTALSATLGVGESFGAANSGNTGSTSITATTSTATTSGDLLVVTIRDRSSPLTAVSSISDNSSGLNTWTQATGIQNNQGDEEIWYVAAAASVTSVTVNVTGAASLAMTVLDISGATATPLDATATGRGSNTVASTGTTGTTSQANEIVVADVGWNGAVSPSKESAGYTLVGSQQSKVPTVQAGELAAWRLLSSTGAQSFSATLSASVPWLGAIATFK